MSPLPGVIAVPTQRSSSACRWLPQIPCWLLLMPLDILLHESGHFLVARAVGYPSDEIRLGSPPYRALIRTASFRLLLGSSDLCAKGKTRTRSIGAHGFRRLAVHGAGFAAELGGVAVLLAIALTETCHSRIWIGSYFSTVSLSWFLRAIDGFAGFCGPRFKKDARRFCLELNRLRHGRAARR